jgi:hypothetical protein
MTPHILGSIIANFEDMERFRSFMLSAIENEKRSFQEFHEKEMEGMSEQELEVYGEMIAEDFFLLNDYFSEVSLYSFIMILYSYVESGLNSICRTKYSDIFRQHNKDELNAADEGREQSKLELKQLKEMNGSGIDRARDYLKKELGVDLGSVASEWTEMRALAKIRNSIVHLSGYANEKIAEKCEGNDNLKIIDSAIKRHVKDNRIEIQNNGNIIITKEYTSFILQQAFSFFKNIDI